MHQYGIHGNDNSFCRHLRAPIPSLPSQWQQITWNNKIKLYDNPFDVIIQHNQCISRSCRSRKYSYGQKYINRYFHVETKLDSCRMNINIGDWFRFCEQSIFETMLKSFNMHLLVKITHFANTQVLDTFHEIHPWDNCRIPVAKTDIVLDIVTSHMYMNKHICIMMLRLPDRLKQIYILVSYTKTSYI